VSGVSPTPHRLLVVLKVTTPVELAFVCLRSKEFHIVECQRQRDERTQAAKKRANPSDERGSRPEQRDTWMVTQTRRKLLLA
jgi:hypothetical protein